MSVLSELASFVSRTDYRDLSPAIEETARRSMLNALGVAIGAGGTQEISMAVSAMEGAGSVPVWGRRECFAGPTAAFINGLSIHLWDFDDTDPTTIVHPSAPVLPAVAAELARSGPYSGEQLLTAFAMGCEIAIRVGLAISPSEYERGWHSTAIFGPIGAAAGVAKLLGLTEEITARAMSLAATQSGGFRASFGSMAKPVHAGHAATVGLVSARLAHAGVTASLQALDGPAGYGRVFGENVNWARATEALGRDWTFNANTFKAYACGVVTHPAIAGAAELRKHIPDVRHIKRIDVRVHPLVLLLTPNPYPTTGLEGKFSVHHCVAMGLLDGGASVSQFTDDRVTAADATELRGRVYPVADDTISEHTAIFRCELEDGQVIDVEMLAPPGSPENPLTEEQLLDKFRTLVAPVLGADRANALAASLLSVNDKRDAAGLFATLQP